MKSLSVTRPAETLRYAAAVLTLTVILSPLGLLASMGAMILTGMILLRGQEEMEIL